MRRWTLRALAVVGGTTLVVATAVLTVAPSFAVTTCAGLPAAGHFLRVGAPSGSLTGGHRTYLFPIESVGTAVTWASLGIPLCGPFGARIAPTGPGWGLTAIGVKGARVAAYAFGSGTGEWTHGQGSYVASGQSIELMAPIGAPISGDWLVVLGPGATTPRRPRPCRETFRVGVRKAVAAVGSRRAVGSSLSEPKVEPRAAAHGEHDQPLALDLKHSAVLAERQAPERLGSADAFDVEVVRGAGERAREPLKRLLQPTLLRVR